MVPVPPGSGWGLVQSLDPDAPVRTNGDVLERIELLCRQAYGEMLDLGFQPELMPMPVVSRRPWSPRSRRLRQVLAYVADRRFTRP